MAGVLRRSQLVVMGWEIRDYTAESLPAIRVVFFENWCVQVFEVDEFGFVWETKFLEDNGHLPRIGASGMAPENDFFCHGEGYRVLLVVVV